MKFNKAVYAGHSGVFLEGPDLSLAIDPWLYGNPTCPQEMQEPKRLDIVVLTHGHSDHAGDASRLGKYYGCKIVANWELSNILKSEGVPESNLVAMNKGGTVDIDGVKITLTHAFHSSSYDTAKNTLYAGEACGVVINDGKNVIYHAGDTALFSDMSLIKESYAPKLAFLPIGDRFTMGPKEAAKAAKLIGCKVAIPIHHSTFDLLTGTPEEFSKECSNSGIECVTLRPGEEFNLHV